MDAPTNECLPSVTFQESLAPGHADYNIKRSAPRNYTTISDPLRHTSRAPNCARTREKRFVNARCAPLPLIQSTRQAATQLAQNTCDNARNAAPARGIDQMVAVAREDINPTTMRASQVKRLAKTMAKPRTHIDKFKLASRPNTIYGCNDNNRNRRTFEILPPTQRSGVWTCACGGKRHDLSCALEPAARFGHSIGLQNTRHWLGCSSAVEITLCDYADGQ